MEPYLELYVGTMVLFFIMDAYHSFVLAGDFFYQLKKSRSLIADFFMFLLSQNWIGRIFVIVFSFGLPLYVGLGSTKFKIVSVSGDNQFTYGALILAIFFADFSRFFAHWLVHKSTLLWFFHKMHHAPEHLNVFTAERSHPVETFIKGLIASLPAIFVDFNANVLILGFFIRDLWTITHHVNFNIPLGYAEYFFTTPQFHRLHHRRDHAFKNLGGIFTIWDVFFGTADFSFRRAESAPLLLGLGEGNSYPQDFFKALVMPYFEAWKHILRILYATKKKVSCTLVRLVS